MDSNNRDRVYFGGVYDAAGGIKETQMPKKKLTPYQQAAQLVKHNALIDIADLILAKERLKKLEKSFKKRKEE